MVGAGWTAIAAGIVLDLVEQASPAALWEESAPRLIVVEVDATVEPGARLPL